MAATTHPKEENIPTAPFLIGAILIIGILSYFSGFIEITGHAVINTTDNQTNETGPEQPINITNSSTTNQTVNIPEENLTLPANTTTNLTEDTTNYTDTADETSNTTELPEEPAPEQPIIRTQSSQRIEITVASTNVILNSSRGTNFTTEDLSLHWTIEDTSSPVKNITNWYINSTTMTTLNLQFEASDTGNESNWTRDYGNNNHGTVNSIIWNATGGHDSFGAYEFNGSSHISTPYSPSTGDISVEAWIKWDGTGDATRQIIVDNFQSGGTRTLALNYERDSTNRISVLYSNTTPGLTADSINPGEWYHIIGTYDGNNISIYMDGVLKNTTTASPAGWAGDYYIGKEGNTTTHYWSGTVDTVRIYNRSLSTGQINQLYNDRTDIIVSEETSAGDVWQACITPNNGSGDGAQNCSNTLTILASACNDNDSDGFGNSSSDLSLCTYDTGYDCNDDNASMIPPHDNLTISSDTWLCSGTYHISNNAGTESMIRFANDDASLFCNSTTIIGNTTGYGINLTGFDHATVYRCNVSGYDIGILIDDSESANISSNQASNCTTAGFRISDSMTATFYNNNATGSGNGFYLLDTGAGTRNNWFDNNRAYDNTDGFRIEGRSNNFTSNTAEDNDNGLYLDGSATNNSLTGNTIYLNRQRGVYIDEAYNNTFTGNNITAQNVTDKIGILVEGNNNTFNGNTFEDNYYGLYIDSSNSNIAFKNTFDDNYFGMRIDSGTANEFYNNSILDSWWGALIDGSSTGNLFYYNNFSENRYGHVNAPAAGNHFNTTIGATAHGNHWEDILSRNIYDMDRDGFGDFGTEYPYNNSNNGHVSGYVNDWGPFTTLICVDDDRDGHGVEGSNLTNCTYPYYGDCADTNASRFPPRDDLNITSDTWICNGTFYLNNTAEDGIINLKTDNITLACIGTVLVGNMTGYGILADNRSGVTTEDCTITNYTDGIRFSNTTNSTIKENTLYNNTNGVYLTNSTGNLVYYNDIYSNQAYNAFSDTAGNQFNTTVSSTPRGNNWGSIDHLKIFDIDGDGYGEIGIDYPYNKANSGNVSGNVTDYGPETNRADYRIGAPILSQPADEEIVTDSRNPEYGWTNPEHKLSDSVTYEIQVDDNPDFSSPELTQANISENTINTLYWNSSSLNFSTEYSWRARADDTHNISIWSTTRTFRILPTTSCSRITDEIDFGSMCIFPDQDKCDSWGLGSHINDTLDNHPPPYVIENTGNLRSKGKIYSTPLWVDNSKPPMPHRYYQFMIGVLEPGSYDWALDSAWVNMTNSSTSPIESYHGLRWENASDSLNLHLNLEVPTDEGAGGKYSTTYVMCEQNETY
ncbi:right-handed parallel beta-helix repeat-containing protein [Nanoarchaeota archaeon]